MYEFLYIESIMYPHQVISHIKINNHYEKDCFYFISNDNDIILFK